MNNRPPQPPLSLPVALVSAVLTFVYTTRWYGVRYAVRSACAIFSLGITAEYIVVGRGQLTHHARPAIGGVPIAIVLAWYITVQHVAILARAATDRPLALPLMAVSYDAMTDPYGLAQGWWEWSEHGMYAPDIVGVNGKHGVPLANFVGWAVITGLVEQLAPLPQQPSRSSVLISNAMITPAYIMAWAWAIRERQAIPVICSLAYACMVAWGLINRRKH